MPRGDRSGTGGTLRAASGAHLAALLLFAALSVFMTWPLASQLQTHLPGHLGDNVVFLWNFWLLRQALADPDVAFFTTDAVFHPIGTSLILHTHSLLNALPGATLFSRLTPIAALNLTVLIAGALNGFSAYLLTFRLTTDRAASLLAGGFFAASPLFTAHLLGHFNYYTAWPLVLFVIALWHARETKQWRAACLAGGLLAAVAYADYYYFVYAMVLALLLCAQRASGLDVVPYQPRRTRLDAVLLGVAATAGAIAAAVHVSGGGVWYVGGTRVSLTSGINVRAVAAAALVWWLWRRRRLTAAFTGGEGAWPEYGRVLLVMCGTCAALMAPLIGHALALWRAGQYVSQGTVWRSVHPGLDPAALVLGNPFNTLWGESVRGLHAALGLNLNVDPVWLGVAPIVLIVTRRAWMPQAVAREWLLIAAVFAVWALGPYLNVSGIATGLPLPQIMLRYVPVASNARVPGHAMLLVCLGVAVLLACAISRMSLSRRRAVVGLGALLVLLDFTSIPVATTQLAMPALYDRLAARPPGAVLDVPFGILDGSGPEGHFDPRALYFQTGHGKPITGGYVSRLSPGVRQAFEQSALMRHLMRLSAGQPSDETVDPARAVEELRSRWKVRYLVLHDETAPAAVRLFIEQLPLRLVEQEQGRRLYAVE